MKRNHLVDDSLIVSRLQQKELMLLKPSIAFRTQFFPSLTKVSLKPFFDNLPLNMGLDLQIIGDKIVRADVDRGYLCHGLESFLKDRSPADAIMAISHMHPACPLPYQIALMVAFEELTDWFVDDVRAKRFAFSLEIMRVLHHLKVMKNVFSCLNLKSLAELVDVSADFFTKQRAFYSRICMSKEVNQKVSLEEMHGTLTNASMLFEEISSAVTFEAKLIKKLAKKAIVSSTFAGSMGLTGPYLRANRVYYDHRHKNSRLNYEKAPLISLAEGGDAFGRFTLRLLEIDASLKWLKEALSDPQIGFSDFYPISIDEDYCKSSPTRPFAFGEIDGFEGDIKAAIFVNGKNNSLLFRIRSPAYFIAQAIPHMLSNMELTEVNTILYSLGITADEIDR